VSADTTAHGVSTPCAMTKGGTGREVFLGPRAWSGLCAAVTSVQTRVVGTSTGV
jgi:hypothetical protein